jgi:hypothetical protein
MGMAFTMLTLGKMVMVATLSDVPCLWGEAQRLESHPARTFTSLADWRWYGVSVRVRAGVGPPP